MYIKIFLDNYTNECFSGENKTMSGRIECTFNNKKKVKDITVKFVGRAETKWTEIERYRNPINNKSLSRAIPQYAKETYMDTEYSVIQGSHENLFLDAGKHIYPFCYTLPRHLPSSFEGSNGRIRYFIQATVERSWNLNYKEKMPLNVVLPMDLNTIPRLRDPVDLSDSKTTRSYLKKSLGVLTFKLFVPVTGYVPGQEIYFEAAIQNTTEISAKCVKFKVVADYEYTARYPQYKSKVNSVVIVKSIEDGVRAHSQKSWTSKLLLPADCLYPNLVTCNIMDVSYTLKAEVVLPLPNSNLKLEVPITIGSIVLSDVEKPISGSHSLVDATLPQYESLFNSSAPYPELYCGSLPPPPYSLLDE